MSCDGRSGPRRTGPGSIVVIDRASAPRTLAEAREWIPRLAAVLRPGSVLEATLGFDPRLLLEPLGDLGLRSSVDVPEAGVWTLVLQPSADPPILDLRDLEAPEPLERMLEACARLEPRASLLARTPRPPRMLFPQLKRRALVWEVHEEPDGTALVHVKRPA